MNRITKRDGDIVYMVKDGELLAPRALSGQEVRQVLQKLADYEDGRHGKWIGWHGDKLVGVTEAGKDIYRHYHYYQCSECYRRTAVKTKYCPDCGANMNY